MWKKVTVLKINRSINVDLMIRKQTLFGYFIFAVSQQNMSSTDEDVAEVSGTQASISTFQTMEKEKKYVVSWVFNLKKKIIWKITCKFEVILSVTIHA